MRFKDQKQFGYIFQKNSLCVKDNNLFFFFFVYNLLNNQAQSWLRQPTILTAVTILAHDLMPGGIIESAHITAQLIAFTSYWQISYSVQC